MADNQTPAPEPVPTLKPKVAGFLDLIPGIGKFLKYVLENFGWSSLAFLGLGFLVGWGVVKWGSAPEFVVGKYRATTGPPKLGLRPGQIDISQVGLPEDLQAYYDQLEADGVSAKQGNLIAGFIVDSFEGKHAAPQSDEATPGFDWLIRTDQGFEIVGRAFRYSVEDGRSIFQPMKLVQIDKRSLRVTVPVHRAADRLIVIIKSTWTAGVAPASLKSIITTSIV